MIAASDTTFEVYIGERLAFVMGVELFQWIPPKTYIWLTPIDLRREDMRHLHAFAETHLPASCWAVIDNENLPARHFARFFGFVERLRTPTHTSWERV